MLSVDLETLGVVPGSAIVSIGAVRFDEKGLLAGREPGDVHDRARNEFYAVINLRTCAQAGLHVNPETLKWWLGKPHKVQEALVTALSDSDPQSLPLGGALVQLRAWVEAGVPVDTVWCYGAAFDVPMLEVAYDHCNLKAPWSYRTVRCQRTLFAHTPIEYVEHGTLHNALDDARGQAIHTVKCLQWHTRARQVMTDWEHERFLVESGLATARADQTGESEGGECD